MACRVILWSGQLSREVTETKDDLEQALSSVCADLNQPGHFRDPVLRIECDDGTTMDRTAIEAECKRRAQAAAAPKP